MQPITLFVNGGEDKVVVEPTDSLLRILRDTLGLTGTKEGCGTGYCGACTVLVDGAPVNACLYFAVDADHRQVTTVEGMASERAPHPLQSAFVECGGAQCGYCTPGMLMASAALLARDPDPDDDRIRAALSGNLCRCTGYQPIVRAVRSAAARMRESAAPDARTRSKRTAVRSRA